MTGKTKILFFFFILILMDTALVLAQQKSAEFHTNKPTVTIIIETKDTDIVMMKISAGFKPNMPEYMDSLPWTPFKPRIESYSLSPGDGIKCFYVSLKDKAGNVHGPTSACLILDTKTPEFTIRFKEVVDEL